MILVCAWSFGVKQQCHVHFHLYFHLHPMLMFTLKSFVHSKVLTQTYTNTSRCSSTHSLTHSIPSISPVGAHGSCRALAAIGRDADTQGVPIRVGGGLPASNGIIMLIKLKLVRDIHIYVRVYILYTHPQTVSRSVYGTM